MTLMGMLNIVSGVILIATSLHQWYLVIIGIASIIVGGYVLWLDD